LEHRWLSSAALRRAGFAGFTEAFFTEGNEANEVKTG
jgi:hypothetical protein